MPFAGAQPRSGKAAGHLSRFFDIEVEPSPSAGAAHSSIDFPRPHTRLYGTELDITGWAMGATAPAVAVAGIEGDDAARSLPTVPRPDVAAAFPDIPHAATSGFYLLASIPDATQVEVSVSIALANGERADAGVIRLNRSSSNGWSPANAPLVSVVIACYNQARFLRRAIESARNQTYPRIEIVVVDDGSTDDTAAVAAELGARCIRQANRGPAAARNRGLQECAGEYVVFLDADDRLLPHGVEANVDAFMERPEAGLVSGWGRREYERVWIPPLTPPEQDSYTVILEQSYGCEHQEMQRRDALIAVGGYDESDSIRATEDWDLHLRMAREHPVYLHRSGPVYEYRQQPEGLSADSNRMLKAASTTLRRQRRWTRGNPSLRSAYRRGVEAIHDMYGRPLAERLADGVRRRDWRDAIRAARTLARFYPRGLLSVRSGDG